MRAIRGSLRRLLCNCSTSAWDMLARTSPTAEEAHMKGRLSAVACLSVCVALTACGGTSKVSSASLQPRLLPSSEVPGFGLQRTLDWSDPVNLVGEGLFLPQRTRPSSAVQEFTGAHLAGAAGEILTSGVGENETEVRVG